MVGDKSATFTKSSLVVTNPSNKVSLKYVRSSNDVSSCGFVILLQLLGNFKQ